MLSRMDDPAGDALHRAFDPEVFRRDGHAAVERLADYLRDALDGGSLPVLPWAPPEAALAAWPAEFPERGGTPFAELLERAIAGSIHLHHPRFVGHQVTAPLPHAALAEFAAALLNNGMAVYEMGPAATAMEHAVVRFLCGALGLGGGAGTDPEPGGVLTSGGSLGNLTALLAARRAGAGFDAWRDGAAAGPPLAFLAGADVHYALARAAGIMGLGADGLVRVPLDARRRLAPEQLKPALAVAARAGRRVLGVAANAGSTPVGAFDPLEEIAEFCAREGLWLHVDGAHGAAAALSPKYRGLVAGIERADSVVWDAHKMLLVPALVTAVLFRDARRSWDPFAEDAPYLFPGAVRGEGEAWFDVAHRTLECTKRMMSFELYAVLAGFGPALLGDYVTRCFDLARRFGELLEETPDFELPVAPEANIVCFRYVPLGGDQDLDAVQERVRRRLIEDGSFYLVQTRLDGAVHLRTTLIHPRTSEADLADLLTAIRRAAAA
jgi:L-2,4-diaminobutyrate decarboxylase